MTDTAIPPIHAVIRLRERRDGTWRGTLLARDDHGEGSRWELSTVHHDPVALRRSLSTQFAELIGVARPGRLITFAVTQAEAQA